MEPNHDTIILHIRTICQNPRYLAFLREGRGPDSLPAPVKPRRIAYLETRTGFPLPELLKRLYLEVGNGCFGPEDGLRHIAEVDDPYGPAF